MCLWNEPVLGSISACATLMHLRTVNTLFTQHSLGGSKAWKTSRETRTSYVQNKTTDAALLLTSWRHACWSVLNRTGKRSHKWHNYVPLQLPSRTFSRLSGLQKLRQSVNTLNSVRQHLVAIRFVRAGVGQFVRWLTTFWTFELIFQAVVGIFCLPLFLFLCPWITT
jgi:hypothetical protein